MRKKESTLLFVGGVTKRIRILLIIIRFSFIFFFVFAFLVVLLILLILVGRVVLHLHFPQLSQLVLGAR